MRKIKEDEERKKREKQEWKEKKKRMRETGSFTVQQQLNDVADLSRAY